MCGIVGLYLKDEALRPQLGRLFRPMLEEMTSRGPDSAGVAVYRDPVGAGRLKISLAQEDEGYDWAAMVAALGGNSTHRVISTHCIVDTDVALEAVESTLEDFAGVRIVGSGASVEIFKETGLPSQVYDQFDLDAAAGTHMIGHTRMATESAVTTAGSHPFATGADLCLVHNGSLSNHNRLREGLLAEGLTFQTENDSEVAAAYLTSKLRKGADIREALQDGLRELDGFYTFAIGTSDGFAVLRDPIACKHAVLAETDDWVAMSTEYRAIATLPGAENARIWEPEPAKIYTWGGEAA